VTNVWHLHNCAAWAGSTAYTVGARRKNGSTPVKAYECISITSGTSASSGGPTTTGSSITDGGVTWKYLGPVDYTTFAAAIAGIGTLSAPTELHVWNDAEWTEQVNFSGNSPTVTNTLLVRPAAGEGFADKYALAAFTLRYNQANGVAVRMTGGYNTLWTVSQPYTTIRGIQLRSFSNREPLASNHTGVINFDGLIVDNGASGNSGIVYRQVASGNNTTLTNCILVVNSAATAVYGTYGAKLYNCTVVRIGATAPTGTAFHGSYDSHTVRNTAFFGFTSATSGAGATFVACATSIASPPSGCTGSLVYADQFVDTGGTAGNQDFRTKAGAGLLNTGNTDTSYVTSGTDIVGTARPSGASWDIGAFELITSTYASMVGALTGAGAAAGVGFGIAQSLGASAGQVTLSGVGRGLAVLWGSLTGTSSGGGTGRAIGVLQGTLAGTSSVSGVGRLIAATQGAVTGSGVVLGTLYAIKSFQGALTGSGTLSGVGRLIRSFRGILTGVGTLIGVLGQANGISIRALSDILARLGRSKVVFHPLDNQVEVELASRVTQVEKQSRVLVVEDLLMLAEFPSMTPDDNLDYGFRFKGLAPGDAIISAEVTVEGDGETAPTVADITYEKTDVLFWLSGGTVGTYTVSCAVTTSQGRELVRSATLKVKAVL